MQALAISNLTAQPACVKVALALTLAGIWGTLGVVRGITNHLRARALLEPAVIAATAVLSLLVLLGARRADKRALACVVALGALLFAVAWQLMSSPEERVHLLEYGAVGILTYLSMQRPSYVRAALLTATFGWIDELIQALIPERLYDLRDVGLNALAGVLGLSLLATYRVLERKG